MDEETRNALAEQAKFSVGAAEAATNAVEFLAATLAMHESLLAGLISALTHSTALAPGVGPRLVEIAFTALPPDQQALVQTHADALKGALGGAFPQR